MVETIPAPNGRRCCSDHQSARFAVGSGLRFPVVRIRGIGSSGRKTISSKWQASAEATSQTFERSAGNAIFGDRVIAKNSANRFLLTEKRPVTAGDLAHAGQFGKNLTGRFTPTRGAVEVGIETDNLEVISIRGDVLKSIVEIE
jgi:hypothetical protein